MTDIREQIGAYIKWLRLEAERPDYVSESDRMMFSSSAAAMEKMLAENLDLSAVIEGQCSYIERLEAVVEAARPLVIEGIDGPLEQALAALEQEELPNLENVKGILSGYDDDRPK